jgi:hypothetical protein
MAYCIIIYNGAMARHPSDSDCAVALARAGIDALRHAPIPGPDP